MSCCDRGIGRHEGPERLEPQRYSGSDWSHVTFQLAKAKERWMEEPKYIIA